MKRITLVTVLVGAILGSGAAVTLAERDLGPEYHELSFDVVTPHFDWAPQYQRGPLRLFSIGHPGHQRDTIELAQRFQVEMSYLFTERFGFGYPPSGTITDVKGASEEARLARFRAAIVKDIDVIVPDGQFLFEVYPDEVTYRILDKVRRGAGLVIFTHYRRTGDGAPVPVLKRRSEIDRILYKKGRAVADPEHFLSAGVPFRGLSPWSRIPDRRTFESMMIRREFGKGRILILTKLFPVAGSSQAGRFTPTNTFDGDYVEPWENEYYYAFAAKALLWAARKEPRLLVEHFRLRDAQSKIVVQVSTSEVSGSKLELGLKGTAQRGTAVHWHIRTRRGEELHRATRPVTEGRSVLPLPALGRGRYYVDALIRQGATTVNWGTVLLDVSGTFVMTEVTASAPSLEPGQDLKLTIALSSPAPAGTKLRFAAIGNYKRLLARRVVKLPAGQRSCAWRYHHEDGIGRMLRLVIKLMVGKHVLDTRELAIPVRLPVVRDEFQTVMWGRTTDALPEYNLGRQLAHLGFDHLLAGYLGLNPLFRRTDKAVVRAARAAARLNLGQWAYITHHHPRNQDKNVRSPCLTDPVFQAAERKKLRSYARCLKHFGVMYFLGDENTLQTPGHDVCFSPTCQADFRKYLKAVYSSLEALNGEWGTCLQSWEQVTPLNLKKARQAKQPARWVDHRLHMGRVWANVYRMGQRCIRETDPGALVGTDYFCPAHGDFGEVEIAQLTSVGASGPREIGTEVIRSLELPEKLKGRFALWGFHARQRGPEGKLVWRALLDEAAICAVFASMPGDAQSFIAADLRPYSYFRRTLAEVNAIKDGVDKLVLPLEATAELAILFSGPAECAAIFHRAASSHQAAYFRLASLIRDAGLNHHILPAEDLSQRKRTSRYKLIFLPACPALSKDQCAALRRYVETGGTLVADLRPGVTNEHGRPLKAGQLDELFGVKGSWPRTTYTPTTYVWAGKRSKLPDALVEEGLVLTTGRATGKAGNVPVLISRRVGKGRLLLLNLSVELSFNGDAAAAGKDLLRALTAEAGAYLPVSQGMANHYQDGANEYVIIVGRGPRRIRFRRPGHLYDGRTRKYLGRGRETTVQLVEHEGRWVSRLPYKVTGLHVKAPRWVIQGKPWICAVAVQASDRTKLGRHVFAAKVFDPNRRVKRYYHRKVAAVSGRAIVCVPFCLNDTPGAWTVRIRDVATGVNESVTVNVVSQGE